MSEWQTRKLIDLVDPTRGISYGVVQPGKPCGHGVPIIRVNNVRNKRLIRENVLKINPEIECNYSRTRLRGGEVLLTIVGTVGETCIADKDIIGWNVARAIAVIPPMTGVSSRWIQICLETKGVKDRISSRVNTTVQTTLNLKDIAALNIPYPPDTDRVAIEQFICALDDKIELNRRMNATLEAMARALFKSWFVDFDPVRAKMESKQPFGMDSETAALFPSGLVPSELGDIPEGWSIEKLGEVSRITIGRTPPRKEQACFVNSPFGTTWLSIRDMAEGNVYAFKSSEGLTVESIEQYRVPIVPKNTVIVSFKLTVGRVALTGKPMATNEAIAHIHIDESPIRSPLYLYCFMKQYDFTQLASTSSIATAVNSESIRGVKVLLPDERTQRIFHDHVKNLFEKIYANLLKIKNLEEIRDYLLPKLISGDIRIPDAEKWWRVCYE